jgi:hypothetical protein
VISLVRPWSFILLDTRSMCPAGFLEVPMPRVHDQGLGVARFSPNGREFAVLYQHRGSPDTKIYSFDMARGRLIQKVLVPYRLTVSGRGPRWEEDFEWLPDGSGWRIGQLVVLRRSTLRHCSWGASGTPALPETWQFTKAESDDSPALQQFFPIRSQSSFRQLNCRLLNPNTLLTGWINTKGDWFFGTLPTRGD